MKNTLVILAAGAGSRISQWKTKTPKPLVKLCGVPLIERTILSAQRAGFDHFVIVLGHKGDAIEKYLGDGSRYHVKINYAINEEWERGNGSSVLAAEKYVDGPFALTMADHLFDPSIFERVRRLNLGSEDVILITDPKVNEVFDIDDATKVLLEGRMIVDMGKEIRSFNAIDTGLFLCNHGLFGALKDVASSSYEVGLKDGILKLIERSKVRSEDILGAFWQDVDTKEAHRYAQKLLLQSMRKSSDTFVSRNFNRPISLFLSKYISRTSMQPDTVSFLGFVFGVVAPVFLVQGEYWGFVVGALFYQFSSILDGCDGEVARLKFRESHRGQWIDTIADSVTHFLFLGGISVGLFIQSGSTAPLYLGMTAIVGIVLLLSMMFQYIAKVSHSGSLIAFEKDYTESVSPDRDLFSLLGRALKPLIRRANFTFLFLVLAILGRVDLILFLMAFGPLAAIGIIQMTFRKKLATVPVKNQN